MNNMIIRASQTLALMLVEDEFIKSSELRLAALGVSEFLNG